MIEVKDLVKVYGDHIAVDHLSFTVQDGQIYGFLGPNGAGKSTTMNIMTGYLAASGGSVIINGHDILKDTEAAKKEIGYLPEIPPVYTDMTVLEYLRFAAELKKVPRHERAGQIAEVMEMTAIDEMQDRLIKNLSKGYRQRVGMAQAILGNPNVIILDEPMVGLDPKQIIEIRNLIKELSKNRTIIISSHILAEISEICDHILIIENGQKRADGTLEEIESLAKDGSYHYVYTFESPKEVPTMSQKICDMFEELSITIEKIRIIGDYTEYEVSMDQDLRREVFEACAQRGFVIYGLVHQDMTLEDTFLKITGEGKEKRKLSFRKKKMNRATDADEEFMGGE